VDSREAIAQYDDKIKNLTVCTLIRLQYLASFCEWGRR